MRKIIFCLSFLFLTYAGFSQTNVAADTVPAYIKSPVIPSFTIYKAPDSTVFTKADIQRGKPTLLMIFSPDCGHCQHMAKEILDNIAHFKKAQILMTTWLPYADMMSFYKSYKIAQYPQIIMAWDSKYFFLPYYHVHNYPKLIVYNKKGKFVKEFQGNIKVEDVWEALAQK